MYNIDETAMPRKMTEMDPELFIEEIKKRPVLWDVSHKQYKDKNEKLASWSEVCAIFCEHFSDKTEDEKNNIRAKYMSKWRNIRDQFRKTIRRKGKPGKVASGKQYIYARHLVFLLKADLLPFSPRGFIESSIEIEKIEIQSPLKVDEKVVRTPSPSPPPTPPPPPLPPPVQRRMEPETSLPNYPQHSVSCDIDEDKSFFDSLLPTVKTFTIDQKLEFRSEILNTIKKIRLSGTSTTPCSNLQKH
ncbi:uncharacterized protein LOC143423753 [Xylocopa sonorina]|uniref:uncharacterized protein LOC143423753 n=1 Tax=Xylocopa sonorina TaxID=1818115 RepID=UPI00403AFB3D